jgi:putative oxidoreductase
VASLIFHPFWNTEPAGVMSQLNNFMKNLAIMGGMLYVMAYGAGPFSVDRLRAAAQAAPAGAATAKKRKN